MNRRSYVGLVASLVALLGCAACTSRSVQDSQGSADEDAMAASPDVRVSDEGDGGEATSPAIAVDSSTDTREDAGDASVATTTDAGAGPTSQEASVAMPDGSAAYHPCKESPCKILPFGDSITHGLFSSDDAGYRSQLFGLVVAANQSVTFTGSLSSGPSQVSGRTFPANHEGHDGFTIDPGYSTFDTTDMEGISLLIPSPAFDTIPDIVLLMIGTNDITSSTDPAGTATRLDALLGKIVAAAPDALVVVAKLTPLGYSSTDYDNYNAQIPQIVQNRAAQGQHIVAVDMSTMPTSDLGNGVHPNDQGYAYMAGVWYAALKNILPQ